MPRVHRTLENKGVGLLGKLPQVGPGVFGHVTIFTLFHSFSSKVQSAQTLIQIMTWRYLILSFHTSKSHHQDEESR